MFSLGRMSGLALAVCGLHLRGQPLNQQLTSLGASFLTSCRSSPCYKFFAITDQSSGKTKPGMIKVLDGSGTAVYLELFSLPRENVGRFLEQIPAPLGLGSVDLEDGAKTLGFICEGWVAQGGPGIEDITHLGSWHAYLSSKGAT